MEIPVSEQMRRLKDKIESFRQMLSHSNVKDKSFDDDEQSESFLSPDAIRYHRLLQKYTQPEPKYPCYRSNSVRKNAYNSNKSDVKSLLQKNGIKNISRGYHYSTQNNQSYNAYRSKKKPILFIRPDTSSESDYSSDESEDYRRPKRHTKQRYNIAQELNSDSLDDYSTSQSQISNYSYSYSDESDSIYDDNESENEEEEEYTDEDIDPRPFKYIGYALQKQRENRQNKQKAKQNNPKNKQKAKQNQQNQTKKRPIQKLAEINISKSSSDDEDDSGDSLVAGLLRNAENIGFITPNSSKINSSDEVILVQKPVLPKPQKEDIHIDSPIKVGKEFDQLINKLAALEINKNDSSDEEALMEYEEEIPDLQGIIQRARATQSDLGLRNSSSQMDSNKSDSDEDELAKLPSFKSLLEDNPTVDEEDEAANNNQKKTEKTEKEFDYKLNLGTSSDDDESGIAQTKKNISEILMGLDLDDSDEHTETDSSLDLNETSPNNNKQKEDNYGTTLKEIQQHLEKPIPKVHSNNSDYSYNNSSDSI